MCVCVSDARDSTGRRKDLIELREVVDQDGATDQVWHFIRGRAYELAQTYFDCMGNATGPLADRQWEGLPLMGLPEAGRGAHWETRIMRDDVMSYGFREAVSSITLAAMEDLGHYVANYSAAQCMGWGRAQGCEYVKTRCGVGSHDRSAVFSPARLSRCQGASFWSTHPDAYLASKCAGGNNPCSTRSERGYETPIAMPDGSSGARCDAQCYTGDDIERADCTTPPREAVQGTSRELLNDLQNQLSSVSWELWLVLLIFLCGLGAICAKVRDVVCPTDTSCRMYAYALCVFQWLVALVGLVGASYLYAEIDVYAAFVNRPTVYMMGRLPPHVLPTHPPTLPTSLPPIAPAAPISQATPVLPATCLSDLPTCSLLSYLSRDVSCSQRHGPPIHDVYDRRPRVARRVPAANRLLLSHLHPPRRVPRHHYRTHDFA